MVAQKHHRDDLRSKSQRFEIEKPKMDKATTTDVVAAAVQNAVKRRSKTPEWETG